MLNRRDQKVVGSLPALGKLGAALFVAAPRTDPVGAGGVYPVLRLLPPPLLPLAGVATVPLRLPLISVVSTEFEDSVPVTSDALAIEALAMIVSNNVIVNQVVVVRVIAIIN
jgi:hypothetical protein